MEALFCTAMVVLFAAVIALVAVMVAAPFVSVRCRWADRLAIWSMMACCGAAIVALAANPFLWATIAS
jgi:hypothetical protein